MFGLQVSLVIAMAGISVADAPANAPAPAQPARWITLGTGGGPVVRVNRSQPANALVVNGVVYLFDVGNGTMRQMAKAGLDPRRVRAIFISHHHVDHDADMGALVMNNWLLGMGRKLAVYGPPGTETMLRGIAAANVAVTRAPITVGGPPAPAILDTASAVDLPASAPTPQLIYKDENIRVRAIGVPHFHPPRDMPQRERPSAYAFRVETADGRIFAYTGDSGPSAALVEISRDADVLVSEVIDLSAIAAVLARSGMPAATVSSMMEHMTSEHLRPTDVGKLAAAARVRSVVLTHLAPGADDEADTRGYTSGLASYFTGKVMVANDGDSF